MSRKPLTKLTETTCSKWYNKKDRRKQCLYSDTRHYVWSKDETAEMFGTRKRVRQVVYKIHRFFWMKHTNTRSKEVWIWVLEDADNRYLRNMLCWRLGNNGKYKKTLNSNLRVYKTVQNKYNMCINQDKTKTMSISKKRQTTLSKTWGTFKRSENV